MKALFIASSLALFSCLSSFGQGINPAPPDKAVVYFARYSSVGKAINFSYFDSATLIGKFSGQKYIRYECTAGHHLFWARSENRDFVEADVEAGKVYFIQAIPKMGAVKAAVELHPVNPTELKTMEKILNLINKRPAESFSKSELEKDTKIDIVQNGLQKYAEEKGKGKTHEKLEKNMAHQIN